MDIIPTSLVLHCQSVFSEIIWRLANLSFCEGRFPGKFKQASVTPLLKGRSLDKSLPSNYRPISNLNFISKVLERLFVSRFQPHILGSSNFNRYQSAYRPGCSTETALQLLLDRIIFCVRWGKTNLTHFIRFKCGLWYGWPRYFTKAAFLQFRRLWCRSFLDWILPLWQNTVCTHGLTLISCDSMHCSCTPRIRPWATTLLCLHFPTVHHCSVPSGPSAAVRKRYAILCRSVTSKL